MLDTERSALVKETADQTIKADAGKPQLHLVPSQIIRDVAEVREYGNRKYGDPESWRLVKLERYVDALYRHLLAFVDDPQGCDAESGIPHYKHMACNMAFICEMMATGKQRNSMEGRSYEKDYTQGGAGKYWLKPKGSGGGTWNIRRHVGEL